MQPYADRADAGRRLGRHVADARGAGAASPVVVLALPRGGVPVGVEVAAALGAPLDVLLVRKLGVPGREELAFGAIASGGVRVLNTEVIAAAQLDHDTVEDVTATEGAELARREARYRGGRPPVAVAGRTVVVVDDGLATGATMRAAVEALRDRGAAPIVAAVPVAHESCAMLAAVADGLICPLIPRRFRAVGAWYEDFAPVSDEEVAALLARPGPSAVR